MERISFFLLLLVTIVSAAPLISVLKQVDSISLLNDYIANSTTLTNLLSKADNFTFLAPSNAAFNKWLGQLDSPVTQADIEETLMYHLLRGGFPTISITSIPQFVPSNLPNGDAANVTGGQVVELVAGLDGTAQFLSANKTISTITTPDIICSGGIIHVIANVLQIPPSIPRLAVKAQLKVFISLLERGGFLATSNTAHIQSLLSTPDTTVFLPNSIAALDAFNNLSSTKPGQAPLNSLFDYHFVAGVKGYSANLFNGQVLRTVQGKNLTVTKRGNDTFINGAKITTMDLITENGVAHVIDGLLDPLNITAPPPLSSGNGSGRSDSVLGVGITFAVMVPVALGLLLFLYCRNRKKRQSEVQKEYLRALENQDKARKFGQPQQAELDSPISGNQNSLPFSNNMSPSANAPMPFSNITTFANTQPQPPGSELPASNRYVPPVPRNVSVYEMDATSVHTSGINKALPQPR